MIQLTVIRSTTPADLPTNYIIPHRLVKSQIFSIYLMKTQISYIIRNILLQTEIPKVFQPHEKYPRVFVDKKAALW